MNISLSSLGDLLTKQRSTADKLREQAEAEAAEWERRRSVLINLRFLFERRGRLQAQVECLEGCLSEVQIQKLRAELLGEIHRRLMETNNPPLSSWLDISSQLQTLDYLSTAKARGLFLKEAHDLLSRIDAEEAGILRDEPWIKAGGSPVAAL